MEGLGSKVRLACYDAADGPRIMFFGPMDVDLQSLQTVFTRLSSNEGPFELETLPFIAPFGGLRIVASSAGSMFDQGKGKPQGIRQVASGRGKQFEWKRTGEGWDYLARLVDSLVGSPSPGHHYLTRYPGEDAIVVVSRGEYGDEVLRELPSDP